MTSTFSPTIYLEEPALGDYANTWSTPVNSNWNVIDQASGQISTLATTGGNTLLTLAQAAFFMFNITGNLTSPAFIIVPASPFGGRRYFFNATNNAFPVYVIANNAGTDVLLPPSVPTPVLCYFGTVTYDGYQSVPVGAILDYAGGGIVPAGFLLCDGAGISTGAPYNNLFAYIGYGYGGSGGTFFLPDLRGRVTAGPDNMGGGAVGRLTGYTLGVTGGAQTVALTTAQLASHTHADAGHSHAVSDPTHVHGSVPQAIVGAAFGGPNDAVLGNGNTAAASTGISIQTGFANIQNTGNGDGHANIQPTIAINKIIRY